MKSGMVFAWLVLLSGAAAMSAFSGSAAMGRGAKQDFDRSAFYKTMSSGNIEEIDRQLTLAEASPIMEKEAYEGALLMKKAGLVAKPADKLKFFKTGRIKLESSLIKDSTNGEYHFLRLTIQEHAPRIVKYAADLEKDRKYIHQTFKNLSPIVQQAIIDYSKHSRILHPEDFTPKND